MAKNLVLSLILATLAQIWAQMTFFVDFTSTDVRNCCKLSLYAISGKTNEPNLRKWQKKPSFRPDFDLNLVSKIFSAGFTSTRC